MLHVSGGVSVLTTFPFNSPFNRLPEEIIRQILLWISFERRSPGTYSDFYTLCLANKRILSYARPILYARIQLGEAPNHPTIEDFTRGLCSHPWLMPLVKELHLRIPYMLGWGRETEAYTLVKLIGTCASLHTVHIQGLSRLIFPSYENDTRPPSQLLTRTGTDKLLKALSCHRDLSFISLHSTEPNTTSIGCHPICGVDEMLSMLHCWPELQTLSVGYGTCLSTRTDKLCKHIEYITTNSNDATPSSAGIAICPSLKNVIFPDAFHAPSLTALSRLAPNIAELSFDGNPRSMNTNFPSIVLVPSLRVWSDNLVKLILPKPRHWLDEHGKIISADIQDTRYSTNISDIIVTMSALRILGISSDFMSPADFTRGPAELVWLDYNLPSARTDIFCDILMSEVVLPQLQHLHISDNIAVTKSRLSHSRRGISVYTYSREWRDALKEYEGS